MFIRFIFCLLLFCDDLVVKTALVEYDFIVRSIPSNPDGYPRSVTIMHHANSSWDVDRPFPGPLIRAKSGDRLRIHITNMLRDQGTAIHFHGLHMINNPWADGTAHITQCAINPHEKFTYEFNVTQTGTFWYHSHNAQQYADGLIGPIIIDHDGIEQRYDYGSNDYIIMLQEWYHETWSDIMTAYQGPYGAYRDNVPVYPWPPTSFLINGHGTFDCRTSNCSDKDTAVYLEFLPGKYQWSLTFMAAWWGVGQMVAGLVAWPFLANYSCTKDDICTNANNSGWRYTFYTLGSFVFVLSFLRLFVIRLKESPKWLLSQNRDAELVKIIHEIAHAAGKECSLTLEQLESIGPVVQNNNLKKYNPMIIWHHIKGLFPNRKMGYSTALNIASWTLIGLAYPLYNVFLPYYLQSRGDSFGDGSVYTTYRNYAIVNVCSVFGPIIAGGLVEVRFLGRRYTMVIGALLTMTFLFAFTAVRTAAQNLAFTVSISVCLNIYYSTLYAYTPEVLPSAHRGTGNAITVACNRVMGIVAALVGTYADLSSSVPIYVCAAAFGGLALLSFLFPFEPQGRTSS
ncbi:unnamed protein product [Rotaria sp. Silwood1]|nr:unnamed protein product [Rotaria sp. Silwood1]